MKSKCADIKIIFYLTVQTLIKNKAKISGTEPSSIETESCISNYNLTAKFDSWIDRCSQFNGFNVYKK